MEIKSQYEDSILFFRLGDFYEMFFEDAKIASEELDLTLTGKDCGLEERAPMCGIPYHSCESYIQKLIERGYKVSICEQTEDPATAKGIVKREVIRVITPGTVIENTMLEEGKNNYLAAISFVNKKVGICFTDASTGETYLTGIEGDNLEQRIINEIYRFNPTEVLIGSDIDLYSQLKSFLQSEIDCTVTLREKSTFDTSVTEPIILKHFNVISTENIGVASGSEMASACGAVISYLLDMGKGGNIAVNKVNIYTENQFMRLDMVAIRNLELAETMRSKSKKGTLLWVIDKTKTAMGKRLLRAWLEKPLLSITEINNRQNAVEELCNDAILHGEASEYLSGIKDVGRIITKAIYGTAVPKDLISLRDTASRFPLIKQLLATAKSGMLVNIMEDIDTLEDIAELITKSIHKEANVNVKDGDIIADGYNEEIDSLRYNMKNASKIISELEAKEREETGIKTLRIRYNKVFGYYIEVTNSFLDKVPEERYIRRQTLTNCERYITEELKDVEMRVLTAKERLSKLEFEIFDGIRNTVADAAVRFQTTAAAIARLDVLNSFCTVSIENNYSRPIVNNSGKISITAGRHPVVEKVISTPFVSNDTYLDRDSDRCAIITGPNMAGKSTYMRQVALITILAQIGCFVPAQSAEIGIVDAVFTRVGASDDLASGQSTFMVEMNEVSNILKFATKESLLILDEIGRGTATFDGMSIARAVLEFIANKRSLGAKSLFATHYHELIALEDEMQGIKNYNIAVKKRGDDIIFLRRIIRGGADDSYGIEVAKLSGIPSNVINRAKAILKQTLSEGVTYNITNKTAPSQMSLNDNVEYSEVVEELKAIDVNTLTPIEAMDKLFNLVNKVKD